MSRKKALSIFVVFAMLLLSLGMMTACGETPEAEESGSDLTSMELTHAIKVGWNLGDTMDAAPDKSLARPKDQETAWGAPVTTKAMIDEVKAAGFNAVRIPTTWYAFTGDKVSGYLIDPAWLDREKEIVDYVIDNDMYCIIDAHYEGEEGGWLSLGKVIDDETTKPLSDEDSALMHERTAVLWKQIAEYFKDYDEHLLFDCFNEPRTINSNKEWDGGETFEKELLNDLYQTFVDTVRGTGGNNYNRSLLCATYAADAYGAIEGYVLPHDPRLDDDKDSRIIVSLHIYEPYAFTLMSPDDGTPNPYFDPNNDKDTAPIREALENIKTHFLSRDIPVVIGETGAANRTYNKKPKGENNLPDRIAWANYYFSAFKDAGVPCFYWDPHNIELNSGEGFGLLDRFSDPYCWYWPTLIDTIMEATETPKL